jgi:arsenite transporter
VKSVVGLMRTAARWGRGLLVCGLVAGILMPGLAQAMKPWLPVLVSLLLFIAALRIGPRQAFGAVRDIPSTVGLIVLLQLVMPVAAIAILAASDLLATTVAQALVLMLAASPISGSPNLTILTGNDPAPALRLLILGTGLLPLTVMLPFWLLPELGTIGGVLLAAGRLLVVIWIAAGAAFLLRVVFFRKPSEEAIESLDGLSAIAMAVVVIGLMSAVGPAIASAPLEFSYWLLIAFGANFGVQAVAAIISGAGGATSARAAYSIVAGNRNIALFLVALSPAVTDPLLLFIGCYQIPMYLTPLLLRPLYRRAEGPDQRSPCGPAPRS